jgi:general stress protein YciG
MAGTRAGGIAAAKKNKAKDPEFYARIGAMGGRKGRTGGFASDKIGDDGMTGRQRAAKAGARGGRISRRTKKAQD